MQPPAPSMQPPHGQPPSDNQPVRAAAAPVPAPSQPVLPWIVLGAGVAAVIGSFLPWASVSAPLLGTITVSGVDGSDGWITAGLGVALSIGGGLGLRKQQAPIVVPILAALAALALLGLSAWKVIDLQMSEAKMRAEMANSTEEDIFGIGRAMSEATHMSVGSGLWLLTFAGLVGLITTIFLIMTSYRGRSN